MERDNRILPRRTFLHCEHLVNVDYSWGWRTDPSWKGMESEPRFLALLKKVGLDVAPT
jgi:hypothetical protein